MRFNYQKLARVAVPLTVALLLCINQPSLARPQSSGGSSGGPISKGIGGIVGAASGAIAGGVAGATAGANAASNGADANSSASASLSGSSGSGGASLSANANLSTGGSSSGGSGGSSSGSSSSSSGSGSLSASGSASLESGSGGSGGSMSAQASLSIGSSTPKPEGIVDKMKEIIKGGKEMIKDSVDKLTKDDKKDESRISAEASASGSSSSSGGSVSGGASINLGGSSGGSGSSSGSGSSFGSSGSGSSGGSMSASANMQSSGGQSSGSASATLSIGSSTPRPEGLLDKMSKIAEKGKEAIKDFVDTKKDSSSSQGGQSVSGSVSGNIGPISASASGSINGGGQGGGSSGSGRGVSANANINIGGGGSGDGMKKFDQRGEEKKEGPMDKVQKLVAKGTDAVRETARVIEDKANTVTDKISKAVDDTIKKPMQSVSGSGQLNSEGQLAASAQATAQLKGSDRDKHLIEVKKEQENKLQRPSSLKEVVTEAKTKGIIPQNEDRSVLRGNHADEKSVAVEVFDKAHEMSKIPVESVLKPIDKMLGYEKDPLMRIYDNSHEILRRPLSLVSKPVESVLTGAFKTTEEAKKDGEKLLSTKNEQERREAMLKEERARKEDRSVVGSIADKTVELATKPIEIVLKPFDHVLGFDKDGKKNPLLRALDELYALSKAPVDAMAKPFEQILKKMADGEQMYQVSLRFNDESSDPKLVTRLADGALNVADRVLTKPLEIVMKPLNHALGYDEPGKKNPIMEAAHSLKNATKVGVELFTKPIDRIIKEIADIGENKSDSEREADFERQKQDASRLVSALDKLHEVIQYPFEIVLRPVGRVLGTTKNGRKDPLLRAWDVIHQVVRTPIQVISKPVEEAFLGDRARKNPKASINVQAQASVQGGQQGQGQGKAQASIGANIAPIKAGASISLKSNKNGGGGNEPHKKNIIIDSIKTVEKFASKPIDVITSPIRKLILGEDGEKVGSETDKNNREIQAKATIGGSNSAQASAQIKQNGGKRPDKIMTTLEKMNNVILKPLEEITQPISDILSSEKKLEVKAQVTGQKQQQPQQPQQQPQQQQQQQQQQQSKGFSASAQAQIKKN